MKYRIGWIRFNQAVELDYDTATSTGIEERMSYIDAFMRQGNHVYMFTDLKAKVPITSPTWASRVEDANVWDQRFHYSPGDYVKCDFLFVESGTTNMKFYCPRSKEPWIREAMKIIDAHKGVVLWYYTDPLIPFPFGHMGFAEYPWGHKNNGYSNPTKANLGRGWSTVSGWGTREEFANEKHHIVLCRSKRYDLIRKYANGPRFRMDDLKRWYTLWCIPIGINPQIRKTSVYSMRVRHPDECTGLVYCGGDRSRRKQFREFYTGNDFPVDVYGKWGWSGSDNREWPGINFRGKIDSYPKIDAILNKSLFTIQIAPEKMTEMGWVTHRLFEAPVCGSISLSERSLLLNSPYSSYKDFLPWAVESKRDVKRWRYVLRGQTLKERLNIVRRQREIAAEFSYDRSARAIIKAAEVSSDDR